MLLSQTKLYSLDYYKSQNHGLKLELTSPATFLYTFISQLPHDLNQEPCGIWILSRVSVQCSATNTLHLFCLLITSLPS